MATIPIIGLVAVDSSGKLVASNGVAWNPVTLWGEASTVYLKNTTAALTNSLAILSNTVANMSAPVIAAPSLDLSLHLTALDTSVAGLQVTTASNANAVAQLTSTVTALGASLTLLQTKVASLGTGTPAAPPPTPPYTGPRFASVNVGPTRDFKELADALPALADGGTMVVDAGTYTKIFHIDPKMFTTLTIQGAGAYTTILDGQGGIGAGHRLSWGKGFIHTSVPLTVIGVGFINGGGGDNVGDGEAGIYAEGFVAPGTLNLVKCAFDNNENGIFVPPFAGPGAGITTVIDSCDFGKNGSNGQSKDGRAHDFYINGESVVVKNSIFFGCAYGNCLKSRARTMTVDGTTIINDQGRCIDRPDGGGLTVTNTIMTSKAGACSNFIGYCNESSNLGALNPVFDRCTVIGTRGNSAIWNNGPGSVVSFTNTAQSWGNSAGGPTFNFTGAGQVTGLNTSPVSGDTVRADFPVVAVSKAA